MNPFNKRSIGQSQRRAKEQASKGCLYLLWRLIVLYFQVAFLPLTLIYFGFIKKDVSRNWRLFYKICALVVWTFVTSVVIEMAFDEKEDFVEEPMKVEETIEKKKQIIKKPAIVKPKEKWSKIKLNDTTIFNTNWISYNVDGMNLKFLTPEMDVNYYNNYSYNRGNKIQGTFFYWDEVIDSDGVVELLSLNTTIDDKSFLLGRTRPGIAYYGIISIYLTQNKDSLKIEKEKYNSKRNREKYKSDNKVFYFKKRKKL